MLQDPRWDKKIEEFKTDIPDRPSLDGFVAWLGTQDPHKQYRWSDPERCACAQYAQAIGRYPDWRHFFDRNGHGSVWHTLNRLAQPSKSFGRLRARAKKMQSNVAMVETLLFGG